MVNINNLKQSIRYETISNATGRTKNTVKADFCNNRLDAESPEDVNKYVTKFILAKFKK
jgi:hypothetical protein